MEDDRLTNPSFPNSTYFKCGEKSPLDGDRLAFMLRVLRRVQILNFDQFAAEYKVGLFYGT